MEARMEDAPAEIEPRSQRGLFGSTRRRGTPRSITHLLAQRQRGSSPELELQLLRWAAGEWLQAPMRSSSYCKLNPEAKSTIALAFSTDGMLFASTHGDHTVKVFRCSTWEIVCTLRGHRRTPWTVKFHPLDRNVLASGSLDESVRIWDLTTERCVRTLQFDFVVSCIAFHSTGELLAVTSGRRIFLCRWQAQREPHLVLPADGQGLPLSLPTAPPRPGLLERTWSALAGSVGASGSTPPLPAPVPAPVPPATSAPGPHRAAEVAPGGGGGAVDDEASSKVVILNGENPQRCVAFKVMFFERRAPPPPGSACPRPHPLAARALHTEHRPHTHPQHRRARKPTLKPT